MRTRTAQAIESDSQRATIWTAEMGQAVTLRDWAHVEDLARAVATVTGRLATD